jgi:hypothetical protein
MFRINILRPKYPPGGGGTPKSESTPAVPTEEPSADDSAALEPIAAGTADIAVAPTKEWTPDPVDDTASAEQAANEAAPDKRVSIQSAILLACTLVSAQAP